MSSRKRKILRVIARLNVGGPSHQAILLSHALNSESWETLLVTGTLSRGEGDASHLFNEAPCPRIKIPQLQRPIHPVKDLMALWKLFWIMVKERPEILHTHTAKAGTLGRMAGLWYRWITRRPLVMVHTFHGHVLQGYFNPWTSRFFLAIERRLAKRTDCLITVSYSVKEDLVRFGVAPASAIRIIPLGLKLEPLLALNGDSSRMPIRIGFIGRLVPIKNPEMLLHAFRKLYLQVAALPAELVFVGDGELRSSLMETSRALGIDQQVQFVGWQRDLSSVYEALDIVCLTSRNEGTPVSLIEALAAGKAVIATDVGGVRELLGSHHRQDGFDLCDHGILVKSGDTDNFAKGLALLLHEPELRKEMGQRGRSFVKERYSIRRLIGDIEKLYEELVSKGSS